MVKKKMVAIVVRNVFRKRDYNTWSLKGTRQLLVPIYFSIHPSETVLLNVSLRRRSLERP